MSYLISNICAIYDVNANKRIIVSLHGKSIRKMKKIIKMNEKCYFLKENIDKMIH
jgi:bisphosphoglycerate-dependent phosphoglycerate mutase